MEVAKTQMLGIPVLRMSGDVDHQTASYLGKAVRDVFNEDDRRLFFDLGDCPYLDSAGLSVLLMALKRDA